MDCIFCKIANSEIPSSKIYEDDKVIAILDLNPAVDGHTLIIPKKHVTDMMDIDEDTLRAVYSAAKKLTPELMTKLNKTAMSLRVNYGDSQEIKHFHLHLLPNYGKDKATMSQSEVYEILK